MKSLLKIIAPKSFNDGLAKCNNLGKKLICKKNIEKFLDVGCGDGKLTMEFAEVAKPKEIYGIEFVDEVRWEAEKKGIKCVKSDLSSKWPFDDDSFDLILSSQSIEHLHNTRLFLEEGYRCLRPGGQLIILTENLASLINIGALLFGWQPFSTTNINGWSLGNPLIWHADEPKDKEFLEKYQDTGLSGTVGHVRVLAFKGLEDLLAKVGFSEIKVYTTGYCPFWGKISEFLCYIDKRHGQFLISTGIKKIVEMS
ncbi:MAG: class I SAM-dependent methyltransferase [Candidatus Omnitrophica bacterium]|nr:class I SAM-dependent methyltransferase [Candidatus Omnitrophota bacterium]